MLLKIDKSGYIYEQVYKEIKEKILDGQLLNSDKLPSIRNLANLNKISINSVRQAYEQLEAEGYIVARQKSGFFVKDGLKPLKLEISLSSAKKRPKAKFDFTYGGIDPNYFPHSTWRKIFSDVLMEENKDDLFQVDPRGSYLLRASICSYLKANRGIESVAEDMVISAGTDHLFYLLKRLLGEEMVYGYEDPGYIFSGNFFSFDFKKSVPLSLDTEGAQIERVLDISACTLLITPAHEFPMGMIMSKKRREELLTWASSSKRRYIIEDDYDGEFNFLNGPLAPLKSMDKNDNVIYMGSFSHSLNPSLRISYMLLPRHLSEIYDTQVGGLSCPVSTWLQNALTEFIKRGHFERHLNKMRQVYAKKHSILKTEILNSKKIKLISSDAGLSFPICIPCVQDEQEFLKKCAEKGLSLSSINSFRSVVKNSPEFLLGFAKIPEEKLVEGVSVLNDILNNL